jgi:AcrR family transcriptional regulator
MVSRALDLVNSHMAKPRSRPAPDALAPRKRPRQARSSVTVDAIFEAVIQVFLQHGFAALTTTRVAERAGVSVGTLYQYFPNKRALVAAVIERHLLQVVTAMEAACEATQGQALSDMANAVCQAFVDVKMARPEVSRALYQPMAELQGQALLLAIMPRAQAMLTRTLASATDGPVHNADVLGLFLLTGCMGPVQAVLDMGAPPAMVVMLRQHLTAMCRGYLAEAAERSAR